jgi:hypothetical protein
MARCTPPPQLPIPDCAVCGRPVERVDAYWEARTQDLIVNVHCHGQTERSVVEACLLHAFRASEVKAGVAFLPPCAACGAVVTSSTTLELSRDDHVHLCESCWAKPPFPQGAATAVCVARSRRLENR